MQKHGNDEKKEEQEGYSDDVILVHVSGAVNKEDVYELKSSNRISDAIEKAGGLREDAYIEDINLAYKLEDGMKIHIPTRQEKEQEKAKSNDTNNDSFGEEDLTKKYTTTSSGISGISNRSESENNHGNEKSSEETKIEAKVNINTATQTELETLPGVGPTTETKILTYRKKNGKFKKIEDIKQVSRNRRCKI